MPIPVTCPNCGHQISAPDNLAGKKARCAKCKQVIGVPAIAPPQATQQAPMRPATDRHNPTTGVPGLKRSGPDRSKQKASNGITMTQVIVFLVVILGGYFGGKKLGLWDSKPDQSPTSSSSNATSQGRRGVITLDQLTKTLKIGMNITKTADGYEGTPKNVNKLTATAQITGTSDNISSVQIIADASNPSTKNMSVSLILNVLHSIGMPKEEIAAFCQEYDRTHSPAKRKWGNYSVTLCAFNVGFPNFTLLIEAEPDSQTSSTPTAKGGDAATEAKYEQYSPALLAELIKRQHLTALDDGSRLVWNSMITEMILKDVYQVPRTLLVRVLSGDGWGNIKRQDLSPDCIAAMRVLMRKIGGTLPTREQWLAEQGPAGRAKAERAEQEDGEKYDAYIARMKKEAVTMSAKFGVTEQAVVPKEEVARPEQAIPKEAVKATPGDTAQPTEPTPPAQPTEPAPKKYAPKPDKALRPGEATYLQKLEQGMTVSVRTRNGKTTECEFVEWDGTMKIKLRVGENTFPCRLVDIIFVKSGEYTIYMAP